MRLAAIFSMLVAFVITAVITVIILDKPITAGLDSAISTPISIGDFQFMQGAGANTNDQLSINTYTNGKAIISNLKGITAAERYQYLSFDLSPSLLFEERPIFFWRAAHSGKLNSIALEETPIDHINLKDLDGWTGNLIEYGFIFTQQPDLVWTLKNLSFSSDSLEQSLLDKLSKWLELEPWSLHSVNFIYGGGTRGVIPPPIVVGIWTALSLLLYWLFSRRSQQSINKTVVITALLAGWILLDARWLFNLLQQVEITHNSYAQQDNTDNRQTGIDQDYFRFFQHLNKNVLPSSPQFIYVLDNNSNYFRAKTPWWLAPHNTLNIDTFPRPQYAKKGGYVLLLHPAAEIIYDGSTQSLRWGASDSLPVTPVYESSLGRLYKIRST